MSEKPEKYDIKDLDYSVVSVSGKRPGDSGDPNIAFELITNGKGWMSEPNCHYPQQIIIKFASKCNIRKIQILVHHYCIPKTIDFYVCDEKHDDNFPNKDDFEKLGTVEFRDNHSTEYNARELKTIFLESEGYYLKLIIHENYSNDRNPSNQVGIMDLAIGGLFVEKIKPSSKVRHRRTSLIRQDKERRISVLSEGKRLGTAHARKLMEKNYAQELCKLTELIKEKIKTAEGEEKNTLENVLGKFEEVHDEAVLLLKQQTAAIGEADEEFAEAIEKQIKCDCEKTYKATNIYEILTEVELKNVGLTKQREEGKPPKPKKVAGARSRSDTGSNRSRQGSGRKSTENQRHSSHKEGSKESEPERRSRSTKNNRVSKSTDKSKTNK